MLWSAVATLLLVVGFRTHQVSRRVWIGWIALSLVFFYLAADDIAQIHEQLGGNGSFGHKLNEHLHLTFIRFDWVIPFAIGMLILLPLFVPLFLRMPQRTFLFVVIVGLMLSTCQLGLETWVANYTKRHNVDTLNYHWESLIEDGPMKQWGLILFVYGLLLHFRDYVEGPVPYRVVAELPLIRQMLSLPGLRILRPESEPAPAVGPAPA